ITTVTRPGDSAASHGGLTQSRRPTARGGKVCCQALAQASSRSGAISTAPGAVEKPKAQSPPAYSRTEATRSVDGALSGKKARRRAGERGPSSSTTPSAPCSQRKFVKPSEVSGEVGTVSCQKPMGAGGLPRTSHRVRTSHQARTSHQGLQPPKSFFMRSRKEESSGPEDSFEASRSSSRSAR